MSAAAVPAPPSASQKRAEQPLLAEWWSLEALGPRLPLVFPVPAELPPSPKQRYRSRYRPSAPEALRAAGDWQVLSDFELTLFLIDFRPLERLLAPMYVPSLKGQVPFDPVSLFLAVCLRREQKLSWRALARLLAGPHGAGWRTRFGFSAGQVPSASGLRYFSRRVGATVWAELCPRFVTLLREHGLFPERSTYPGDPAERGITVIQDGMLHPARHRPSCPLATDSCYGPRAEPAGAPAPAAVPPAPSRPCRAREKGREGCLCQTAECQTQCRRASHRDPQARLIHYAGHNHKRAAAPGSPVRAPAASAGRTVFGYRSIAERALDDRFAVAWTLCSQVYPANTDERTVFPERVRALPATFPDLAVGEWLADAGVGFDECLAAVYDLGALRLIDPRAHPTDADPDACRRRGYDATGRPLCPHGYRLRTNGYDSERRRTKYVCAQVCRRTPVEPDGPIEPVRDCPYFARERPLGFIVNVGRTLPDGSLRLAREIPVGSPAWQARYGRRNLAESRNGQIEGLGLKRLPDYGLPQARQDIQVADFLLNLRTLGRLVRQASTGRPAA